MMFIRSVVWRSKKVTWLSFESLMLCMLFQSDALSLSPSISTNKQQNIYFNSIISFLFNSTCYKFSEEFFVMTCCVWCVFFFRFVCSDLPFFPAFVDVLFLILGIISSRSTTSLEHKLIQWRALFSLLSSLQFSVLCFMCCFLFAIAVCGWLACSVDTV